MNSANVIESVRDADPAREYGDVGDERDIPHEEVALGPGIAAQNPEVAVEGREPEDGVGGRSSYRRRWGR